MNNMKLNKKKLKFMKWCWYFGSKHYQIFETLGFGYLIFIESKLGPYNKIIPFNDETNRQIIAKKVHQRQQRHQHHDHQDKTMMKTIQAATHTTNCSRQSVHSAATNRSLRASKSARKRRSARSRRLKRRAERVRKHTWMWTSIWKPSSRSGANTWLAVAEERTKPRTMRHHLLLHSPLVLQLLHRHLRLPAVAVTSLRPSARWSHLRRLLIPKSRVTMTPDGTTTTIKHLTLVNLLLLQSTQHL